MATTVPMLAPDGTSGDIPSDKVQAATAAGFKQAVAMTSPDGKTGYIPVERQQDAMQAGFKPIAPPSPPPQTTDPLARALGQQGQTDLEKFTQPTPHDPSQGILGNAKTALSNIGAAGINALTHPEQLVTGAIAASPPGMAYQNAKNAYAHLQGKPNATDDAAQHPVQTLLQTGENLVGQAGALGAPEAASEAAGAARSVLSPAAIKEQAGGVLQSVAHDANKVPVQLENAGDPALKLMDWQKVTQLGPTVNKFLNRITNPKLGPLTYEEGRQFYQVLGQMSADETMKMSPPIRRQLTQLVVGLKEDLGNAADTVGKAADYYQGLGDYAKGAKLQNWYDLAQKYAIRGGLAAAGAAGVGTAAKFLIEGATK